MRLATVLGSFSRTFVSALVKSRWLKIHDGLNNSSLRWKLYHGSRQTNNHPDCVVALVRNSRNRPESNDA